MEQPFSLETKQFPHGLVLKLYGELTRSAEKELIGDFAGSSDLGSSIRFLALDISQVAYINSGGMALLIRLARMGRKAGAHTFAWGVTPHYEKLFRMVGLTEYLMLYPNEFAVLERIDALEL
ncbi:anti-sigma factor antagonist [Paenibacillus baekrokdamisoli]|uniref:Anti-sigma factor antagonist n=1 Tax=Paenibacillus baekrokdamisoli TaxID=1712516 RepID=A0A3G9IYG8_9BACL|nr:STAS domain-containing protein [Paenibacillus baekrokdamisoli]MBB3073469.1 stage II sporulation protein AA (anti-sigma F factor antagonist) [Paenibacillus baekrokdamisoli]BBH23957.1 anti-sigma factor antagonist [Paenibacillus baekrokdamisoli]